jgi:hypothetical protein
MNYLKVVSSIFSITAFLFLSSCSDSVINHSTGESITVEGRLLNVLRAPVSGMKVKINDEIVITNSEGKFVFNDIVAPYDIVILDSVYKKYFLYKNVTTKSPLIEINTFSIHPEMITVNVTLPASNNYFGKIIFTNFDDVNNYGSISTSNGFVTIWTSYHNNIEGAIIVLLYEKLNGRIVDYKNFGMKNLTVVSGNTYTVNFTEADLDFDPDEAEISGSANLFSGTQETFYYLSFSTKPGINYANVVVFEQQQSSSFSYVVPMSLPINYYPVIFAISPDNLISERIKSISSNIIIDEPEHPSLIFPENNATGVNASTIFRFTKGGDTGMYNLSFEGEKSYTIVTANNDFNFADMEKMGFDFNQQQFYNWRVSKDGRYSSMYDFLTSKNLDMFRVRSESRSFSTSGN